MKSFNKIFKNTLNYFHYVKMYKYALTYQINFKFKTPRTFTLPLILSPILQYLFWCAIRNLTRTIITYKFCVNIVFLLKKNQTINPVIFWLQTMKWKAVRRWMNCVVKFSPPLKSCTIFIDKPFSVIIVLLYTLCLMIVYKLVIVMSIL